MNGKKARQIRKQANKANDNHVREYDYTEFVKYDSHGNKIIKATRSLKKMTNRYVYQNLKKTLKAQV